MQIDEERTKMCSAGHKSEKILTLEGIRDLMVDASTGGNMY